MSKNQMHDSKTSPIRLCVRKWAIAALAATLLPLSAQAQAVYSPDSASANCNALINSADTLRSLDNNSAAARAVRLCIDMGIDPPLRTRNADGKQQAAGVPSSQIPRRTCPPFGACLMSARVNSRSATSSDGNIKDLPIASVYTAPQFKGHLPDPIPAHLINGSTMYFQGDDYPITPPKDSLIYPTYSSNYYADGGRERISNTHIMTAPAPKGEIMEQKPTKVHAKTRMNFDDSGIIVLAEGYRGKIDGVTFKAGEPVWINHAGDITLPPGTKLYPLPMGSNPKGAHIDSPTWEPYRGPAYKVPADLVLEVTKKTVPGAKTVWWKEVPIEEEADAASFDDEGMEEEIPDLPPLEVDESGQNTETD